MIKIHLSRLLGERKMTQAKLVELSKVRPGTIREMYYETLKRFDVATLNAICTALDCKIEDLLEYIPDEK